MKFEHYHLRPLVEEDAENFYDLIAANRQRLEFFSGTVSKTATLEKTIAYLAEVGERRQNRSYFPFLLVDDENGRIAGFIDVKNIDWNIPKGEFGCFLDQDYAGKGLSVKALNTLIQHLREEYGFRKLFLRTHPNNLAARKLAESCGFVQEGILRLDYKTTAGELVDLVYYGLVF